MPAATVVEPSTQSVDLAAASPTAPTKILGFAYLVITLCGALGVGVLDAGLQVDGDHLETAKNIASHGLSFRLGVFSVLIIYASVLVASWALYLTLERVDRRLSLVALLFRVAEALVGFTTMLASLMVVRLLRADGPATQLSDGEAAVWVGLLLELRTAALDIVLFLIGVGGTTFFVLFWRARLIPRWLAGWGIFTYLSMLGLATVSMLFIDHPRAIETALYGPGALFEGVFALWMLGKGIDKARWCRLA